MGFGARFRHARTNRRLSQQEVADQLGVTKATISAWESERKLPESQRLPEISEVLSSSIDALFGLEDQTVRRVQDVKLPWPMAPEISELLRAFGALNDVQRAGLIRLLTGKQ